MRKQAIHAVFASVLAPLALSAQGLPVASPEDVGLSSQRLERIERVFQEHIDAGRIVGMVGLVARRGKVAYYERYGLRDQEAGDAMPRDAIFRIYSMTKPVTSVAAMILFEEGEVLLTDPVSRYLPEFGGLRVLTSGDAVNGAGEPATVPARREITIQDLLRHTSGLTYGIFSNTPVDSMYRRTGVYTRDTTLSQTVTKLSRLPLLYQPGTRWHYSLSADVLGRLVEVVSGTTLDRFFQDRIFGPLGMPDTRFYVEDADRDRMAALYRPSENGGLARIPPNPTSPRTVLAPPSYRAGGAGLVSTAADYVRFAQMLLNGGELDGVRILSRKTVELMTADHLGDIPGPGPGFGFGLGVRVREAAGLDGTPGSVGEFSWGGAAGTSFWIDPQEELIGVFMIQILRGGGDYRTAFKALTYQAVIDP